jgi:hypothetical protein
MITSRTAENSEAMRRHTALHLPQQAPPVNRTRIPVGPADNAPGVEASSFEDVFKQLARFPVEYAGMAAPLQ